MTNTKPIIEKWYRRLAFPAAYDAEFYAALNGIEVPEGLTPEDYDTGSEDGKRNLLTYLYFCEQFAEKAAARGIPEEIVTDTLRDLVIWTENYTEVKGALYLGELNWLILHMRFTLFKIGRLQFRMGKAAKDIPAAGVEKGAPVLEIHIPRGGKLEIGACLDSIERAKAFFARYFPEFQYKIFTCSSWLLDDTLREYLPETSNIIRFGNLFTKISEKEYNALLTFIFRIDTTEENLAEAECTSAFARRVKEDVLAGKKFHMTYGYILK